ncbi:hypothetical protein ATANTOWER_000078 [Ataeniobius toweri]|uniref:Uncharacterized protein n=1 Tax=Ataeniobius toweri TaxID=208326 RepID=A0ABU7B3F7_9TELE|nr:hypothetical protein [Ataeniobius toweri]
MGTDADTGEEKKTKCTERREALKHRTDRGGHTDMNIWVCVRPQVISTDDSCSAGHCGVSGNCEPLPRGRREKEEEEG